MALQFYRRWTGRLEREADKFTGLIATSCRSQQEMDGVTETLIELPFCAV